MLDIGEKLMLMDIHSSGLSDIVKGSFRFEGIHFILFI